VYAHGFLPVLVKVWTKNQIKKRGRIKQQTITNNSVITLKAFYEITAGCSAKKIAPGTPGVKSKVFSRQSWAGFRPFLA